MVAATTAAAAMATATLYIHIACVRPSVRVVCVRVRRFWSSSLFFFSFRWTTTMSACRAVEAAAAASAAAPWPTHVYHFLPFCSNAKPFIHKMWTSTIVMRTQHNGGWVAASSPASSDTFAHSIIACDSNVVVTKCTRHTDTATQSLYINL